MTGFYVSFSNDYVLSTVIILCVGAAVSFLSKLFQARSRFGRLSERGMLRDLRRPSFQCIQVGVVWPMLPHSFVWGHLLQLRSLQSRLPSDGHVTNVLSQLAEKFSDSDSVYYIDTWPFSPPIMVLSSPNTAFQAVQQHSLREPAFPTQISYPVTGGPDVIFMNGEQWKESRSIFKTLDSTRLILSSQVPAIVEEIVTFIKILRDHYGQGQVFRLDPVTLNMTLDVDF